MQFFATIHPTKNITCNEAAAINVKIHFGWHRFALLAGGNRCRNKSRCGPHGVLSASKLLNPCH